MRTYSAIFLACLISSTVAIAQDAATLRLFDQYEEQRHDKATALVLSSLVPGGGLFYNGKIGAGIGVAAGTLIWVSMYDGLKSPDVSFWWAILAITRIVDIVWSINAVDDYNAELRARLKISVSAIRGSPMLKVSVALCPTHASVRIIYSNEKEDAA